MSAGRFTWPIWCVAFALAGCGQDRVASPEEPPRACGNAVLDADEECDGDELDAQSCETLGYASGTLSCRSDCTLSLESCVAPPCGDGIAQPLEECDRADLRGQTCALLGYDGGALGCSTACLLDVSACIAARCGNDVAGDAEACDGADLRGESCLSLGVSGGGTLGCSSGCHSYDTSGCGPALWTCDKGFYGMGDGCNCGCGLVDPDCADATVSACSFCDDPGSCAGGPCPANIDPTNNGACL